MPATTSQEGAGAGSSGADSTVSQVGAGAGGAQAGVGTEARGSQTGAGQAGVGAAQQTAQAETGMDIGQAEAYTVNMKRLVSSEQDHDAIFRAALGSLFTRVVHNAHAIDNAVNNLTLQITQNAVSLSQRVTSESADHVTRLRHYSEGQISGNARHTELATDRIWNPDEVAGLIAKNPIFQDAIAGAVAAAVAAAVAKKE